MAKPKHTLEEPAGRGREAAFRVLADFEGERVVPAFVDAYVRQHNRRELKTSPLRYRELLVTLTRESLVAVAANISGELERRVTGRRRAAPTAAESEALDAFQQAFIGALGAALRWTPGDIAEFARDVALYARMAAFTEPAGPESIARSGRADSKARKPSLQLRARDARSAGPFADRCALLLDPSLLDKARASAIELHGKLETIAADSLSIVLKK